MGIGRPKGSKNKNTEEKRFMSKDGVVKIPYKSEWQAYLDAGWHFGNDHDIQKSLNKKWYNNGKENIILYDGDPIPDGFVPGMFNRREGGFAKFKYKWYTNGIEQKKLSIAKGDIIPEGWWEGQSESMKEANRLAQLGKKRTDEQKEHYREGSQKAWKNKIENGTANSSFTEETLYLKLVDEYSEVKRNYNEDPRYSWHCDFYIPSIDLFIEVNDFPTHYTEPFDSNNEEHLKLLEQYKTHPKDWVEQKRVGVWAGSDVLKRETAKKNNLNYIMLYGGKEYRC